MFSDHAQNGDTLLAFEQCSPMLVLPGSVDLSVQAKDSMQEHVPAAITLYVRNETQLMIKTMPTV